MHILPLSAKSGLCTSPRFFSSPPFSNLSQEASSDLDLVAITITLPRGAVLFRENAACPNVMILSNGEVKLSCTSKEGKTHIHNCLLYTSDAADDLPCVDLGGRRI